MSPPAGEGVDGPVFRVRLDRERCIGAGVCLVAAPEAFRLDSAGRAVVDGARLGLVAARRAASHCPLAAIEVEVVRGDDSSHG